MSQTGKRAGLALVDSYTPLEVEHVRRHFQVRLVWTRHPMGFQPWRPSWWRGAWMTWARWAEAWAVMGWLPHQVESTCVAFGPFVVVVDHPCGPRSER